MNSGKILKLVTGIIFYTLLIAGGTYLFTHEGVKTTSQATPDNNSKQAIESSAGLDKKDKNWIPLPEFDLTSPGTSYDIKSLTSEVENTLDLRSLADHSVQINGVDVSGKESYSLSVKEISEENKITITIDGEDYYLNTLPETLSNYGYENNGAEDGYYYFTYDSYIVKLSTNGKVVYYNDVGSAFDFKLNKTDDGKIYYSYLVQANTNDEIDGIGNQAVKAVIMDESYDVVDVVESLIPTDLVNVNPLDNHEFIFLDLGHYIVSSYYREEVFNVPSSIEHNKFGTRVVAPVIQEIKDGEVLFEWKGTEHPELYGLSIEHNDFTNHYANYADYFHFNSIAIDPDDKNLIVSSRNLSTILKIDRDTGEVIWKLGGKGGEFGLDEEKKFSRQHNLSFLSDGTILLFNNGNVLPKAPYPIIPEDSPLRDKKQESSIMMIKVDEEKKKVVNYENYPTGEFTATRGSVQMLNEEKNIVLIGWGSRENNDATFTEKNLSTGEELFVFYPNNKEIISYRAYKFDQ